MRTPTSFDSTALVRLVAAAFITCGVPVSDARSADAHAGHTATAGQERSVLDVVLPRVPVTRADGRRMSLAQALDDGRPVVLNFIYTSCNTICPVTSQLFVELRERLGAQRNNVNMVSISIDPEQDTPARLTDYAARFGSAGVWPHYTSTRADAIKIQQAFGAWRGDKMNHQPTTYLRAAGGTSWVRLDGFFAPTQLAGEYVKTTNLQAPDDCSGSRVAGPHPQPPVHGPASIRRNDDHEQIPAFPDVPGPADRQLGRGPQSGHGRRRSSEAERSGSECSGNQCTTDRFARQRASVQGPKPPDGRVP